jgi:hypothetical protein
MKNYVNTKTLTGTAVVFALLVMFTASSCKKSTYYKLTEEDMAWLVYDDNEVVKFRNSLGQTQQYRVAIRQKYYNLEGETYSERTSATFVLQNDTTLYAEDSKGQLFIGTGEGGLFVTFSWPHFPIQDYPLSGAPQQILTLGGINYADIIVIDGSLLTDIRRYVKTIWYSKSQGVVQYEDTYGNVWNKSL